MDEGQTNILVMMMLGSTGLAGLLLDLGLLADSKILALPFVFGALIFTPCSLKSHVSITKYWCALRTVIFDKI